MPQRDGHTCVAVPRASCQRYPHPDCSHCANTIPALITASQVGKEYKLQKQIDEGSLDSSYAQQRPTDLLQRLGRNGPYYKRNEAKVRWG